ncbi:MAG: ATP-binding protein [Ornithinibacter sp.]
MSGRLVPGREAVKRLTIGSGDLPSFSSAFPAAHLQTERTWENVVLHPKTQHQIQEIENWVKDDFVPMGDRELGKRVKAGYRVLFHGPAGTGKALTATLLGKTAGRPVLRIDLARVLSKYIGETEKNLSRLFDAAREKDWILFFDEADALFGKRTAVRDSHDRYANQEVAYLLQAIETHPGLVIVATNQRNTNDDAFLRRFQASIEFLHPTRGEPIAKPPQRRGGHRPARGPEEPSSAQRLRPDR